MAIKCLMAGLKTPCSTEMSSMLNFEIGKMLWYYSKNTDLSRHYLTQAFNMMKDLGTAFEDARLKVVCLIAELYLSQRMYEQIKALLKNEAHISMKYPFFHGKILFYLAEVYLKLNDFENALQVVDCGIIYFRDLKEKVVECYFRLAKSLLLATQMTNQHELGISVTELGEVLTAVPANHPAVNDMRAYCYTIQLCYFLATGMYSNYERVNKYYAIALKHVEDLRVTMRKPHWIIDRGHPELLNTLEVLLYEGMAQTQLIICRPAEALNNIGLMIDKMRTYPELSNDFESQAHTLIGLYAIYMRHPEDAEKQFQAALRCAKDTELWTMINLSLAIIYLFTRREQEFYELFQRIAPNKLKTTAISLKSVAYFVHALHSYLHNRTSDCKTHLTDSINISKDEDMARIQSMALLLLSKLLKDPDILRAAYEWTSKSSDLSLMVWANTQILNMHQQMGQMEQASQVKQSLEPSVQGIENERQMALQSPGHQLIKWIEGGAETIVLQG
uniref:MAU2 chromatid cohesion factor homolog n=1 Tax=Acrobeloides nanus TaxID=290746 RepID=A0A914BZ93_9BILA